MANFQRPHLTKRDVSSSPSLQGSAANTLKRKSISFDDKATEAKASKPGRVAPPPRPTSKPKFSGAAAIYAPPTGKYSKNVGQYGEQGKNVI